MYGRGAVDMKGGVACFVAAVARHIEKHGSIRAAFRSSSPGDEERPCINGTVKLLDWAKRRGESWDASIVGEPSNPNALGDAIKIGRRGSLSGTITVHGVQGHAATIRIWPKTRYAALPRWSTACFIRLSTKGQPIFRPAIWK